MSAAHWRGARRAREFCRPTGRSFVVDRTARGLPGGPSYLASLSVRGRQHAPAAFARLASSQDVALCFLPSSSRSRSMCPLRWRSGWRTAAPRSPMTQQRRQDFLPLPASPPFLAEPRKSLLCCPSPAGASAIATSWPITVEAAMVRVERKMKETFNGNHR